MKRWTWTSWLLGISMGCGLAHAQEPAALAPPMSGGANPPNGAAQPNPVPTPLGMPRPLGQPGAVPPNGALPPGFPQPGGLPQPVIPPRIGMPNFAPNPRPLPELPAPVAALPLRGTEYSLTDGPLDLGEVLNSVEQSYPTLLAVLQERAVADGRRLSAMGAFDTNLKANSLNVPAGTYENNRFAVGVDQAFMNSGVTTFAGYRGGYGDFQTYYLDRKTALGGELKAGVLVPLLKDNDIDKRRATLFKADIDRALVEPSIERQRLDLQRAAARAYWFWVAAGIRVRIAKELYQLALERDSQLADRVARGAQAEIERVDNQQNVAARASLLAQAEQVFQQAAIDLSLFLRDSAGRALIPAASRLPKIATPQPLQGDQLDQAIQLAYRLRPELVRLRLQRDKLRVDLRLAENQMLPGLNLYLTGSQDMGSGKSSTSGPNGLDRSALDTGVEFSVPVQRREARGQIISINAQLAQLNQQERLAIDAIRAEVQNSWTSLDRIYEAWRQTKARVDLARTVAEAEREQFRLGRSTILTVTLREQAAFDAEVSLILAAADYFRSLADYRAALGVR
ncbi:TolC family protein [Tuwongella immobilis]|uniref:Outer membrane efflux protein n=1 Tax=Tuwongella immobilis TaxID=692036 RepID=A0A6C2YGY6_9BACT|nr:TolC family protein [Tuwongella immobilis]VIP00624.1 outer membrane efflux protein : Outer membrane efflux protein OS=Pirellula staleyi (strain ATCC 27377 / DSM 6068 / ICPB 4128) GN=Psta_2758 PE=4 SV=1: OEP [Tuwongella immobilis]VTR96666.1 outer membrane efflux protein : Outer membrane efflux protein OS=Pirellula staleyi (strain ATCC 27377 / DSM 6068 / ICPB 4128) GN=Psta_2758 PE=4 SV=1: OEP [Tuwongella immobilis]